MSTKGYVLKERAYIGSVTPPDAFEDESRFGNDGVHTNVTWVKNPAGIWVRSLAGNGYVKKSIANFRDSDYQGAIAIWFRTSTTGALQELFSSCDEGTTVFWLQFAIGADNILAVYQSNNDDSDLLNATTDVCDGVWHQAWLVSSGTAYSIFLDGVSEGALNIIGGANSGDWFADTLYRDNFLIGARERTSVDGYLTGSFTLSGVLNYPPSAEQIAAIYQSEKHWFGR